MMSDRDRRALTYLGIAVALAAVYELWQFWPEQGLFPQVTANEESVAIAEQRLERLRGIAATLDAKQEIYDQVAAELAAREQGLIQADTAPQAQAQLIQILQRLAAEEGPSIEIRATELRAIRPIDEFYAAVDTTVQFQCRIEQLINFLASLTAQPELITTRDLRINQADRTNKTIDVRMTVSAIVPRSLLPNQQGAA